MPTESKVGFEPVNIRKLLAKYSSQNTLSNIKKNNGFQTSFFNPYDAMWNSYHNLRVAERELNGDISCDILRRVSKKAFVINICINFVLKKIKPFLKPSTDTNTRGYIVHKKGEAAKTSAGKKSAKRQEIETFLQNCGTDYNSERDDFQRFCLKVLRDSYEIDQVASEIGYTRGNKPYAFQAVDAATIRKVIPGQDNPDKIRFIQVIDGIPQAFYTDAQMVFDYQNPRTDINHGYYGYSITDQIIDLITSSINTFSYNAGFFTENKLPRGMLLIDGNVSQDTVEEMEDYISDIMSGTPSSQWRVPILPSGSSKSGDNNGIKWVQLGGTNKDMEFQQFMDFQVSGIVAMFGCSMDELGLQTNKSQAIFERSGDAHISASKSTILGDSLGFLQKYVNRILERFYPDYELEFVGYEKEDPSQLAELASKEMGSYKTVNEIREEKGLEKLESEWADKVPANPQLVQLYQAEQAQNMGGDDGGMGDFGDGMDDDGGEDFGDEETGNAENENSGADKNQNEDDFDLGEKQPTPEEDFGDLTKSMRKSFLVI